MPSGETAAIKNHAAFIWSVADLLRGDYRRSEYGRVILPLTVIRRLDCVLEPTKSAVLAVREKYGERDPLLRAAAGVSFYNTSRLTLSRILDDPVNTADQLLAYLAAFSPNARDVIAKFDFPTQVSRLNESNLLYLVLGKFCDLDLHPDQVSNVEMGAIYEELIRRSFEAENETAGEHFTPREVIRLMVDLLFCDDDPLLGKRGIVKTLFDPACGTGGMLSVAEDRLRDLNAEATLQTYGQELNARTYAICRSDMMIKGEDADNIAFGNSFTDDQFDGERFDYLLANPPFGVEWKKVAEKIKAEHAARGFGGRFGAGLPRVNDGSFLFLQHMMAKMKRPGQGGSRLAIVFNGSPLFTGAAGSGESEIRRWIIENDWLEAVVALPDQLFYNTGISTYFWVVTNRKSPRRHGKVQLIDARECSTKMRKSLGEKRKEIPDAKVSEIVRLYGDFTENEQVKIFPNEAFCFLRITVDRPLRLRWGASAEALAVFDADPKLAKLVEAATRVSEQQRIAGFLDAETNRIDTLIVKKRHLIELMRARRASIVGLYYDQAARDYRVVRLRYLLRRIEQGWSPECENRKAGVNEWGVLKAGCVNDGVFRAEQNKALPAETIPRLEYALREGDLLMSRASGSRELIGSAAVVGKLDRHLLLCDKIYRLHVNEEMAIPEFVAAMIRAPQLRELISLGISGASGLANNLPTAIVLDLPVPRLPIQDQWRLVRILDRVGRITNSATHAIENQIELLKEHRQALITAAVTGQLNVARRMAG